MTASVVALAASPPRAAAQECGAPVGGAVTCPAGDYPTGINYGGAVDLTLTADPGVNVVRTALGAGFTGIGINNSDGLASIIAPDVNIDISSDPATNNHYGVSASTFGLASDASASAGGTILVLGTDNLFGVYAQVVGGATATGNATASLTSGSVTVEGSTDGGSVGVYAATSGTGTATAEANGDVTASLTAGQTIGGVYATAGEGDAVANFGGGTMTVTGARAYGLAATSNTGSVTATSTDGSTIIIAGSDTVGGQQAVYLNTAGTEADGAAVTATIASTIQTSGLETFPILFDAPMGILALSGADAPITLTYTGPSITTTGAAGTGIFAASATGDITITSSGDISTDGLLAAGIAAYSGREQAPPEATVPPEGPPPTAPPAEGEPSQPIVESPGGINITSTGAITTLGDASHGIAAYAGAGEIIIDAGDINASGMGSNGIVAVSDGAARVTVSGNVQGGWAPVPEEPAPPPDEAALLADFPDQPPFATGAVLVSGEAVTLDVNGSLGALSDSAILGLSPLVTVNNNGTVTGFVSFGPGDTTFNNLSSTSLDLRNFADTDGDGVRDTEAVALSDFGGGVDTFNNEATGAVTLLNVAGATTIDLTGAVAPEGSDPAFHDITIEGVEQGVLANLETFNNAGAIILQDALAGGAGPVAGDVLQITGSEGAPANFVSNGGTLALDTVLNEGGAVASQSDVLMLDMTTLGTGATALSIANAGGTGAQTVENGILVVDVADPAASAAGAFALNDFVIAGAYQYQLYQGGDADNGGDAADGNWYLRSNISPTTDIYRAYPSALMRFSRTAVGTLQQRLGNRWWRVPESQVERTVTDPAPPPPPAQTREFIVYFDWDRSEIREDAAATIREAAEYAKSGNAARIVVVGHTDTSGSTQYNLGLSERRAQAVSGALQGQGVAAQVIGMEWLGETQPAVNTGDGVREERNRRATVTVDVPYAGPPPQARTRTVMDVVPASTEIQGSGVWGRILGAEAEYNRDDDLGGVDEDLWMAQAGVDFLVHEDEESRLIAGVSIHYGEISTDVNNSTLGELGSIDSTGAGVSASLTYYNENGVYMDGVLSGTWYETDLDSDLFGGELGSNDATAWAISFEGGKRIPFSPESNYYWVPQGQLIYTSSDVDTFTDPFGAEVSDSDSDSLVGRLGVAFEYLNRTTGESGEVNRMQGYGSFSVLYEFLGMPGASVSGIDLDEDINDFWGEFGAGFTYSMNDQWSFFGEGLYRTAFEDFGDSYSLQGSLGVRYNW